MDRFPNRPVELNRKLLKVQMESKVHLRLVIHLHRMLELVGTLHHRRHLVQEPVHLVVKRSATVDLSVVHHLAVVAVHKLTLSVVRIIPVQMQVQMLQVTHTIKIVDPINLFSINRFP